MDDDLTFNNLLIIISTSNVNAIKSLIYLTCNIILYLNPFMEIRIFIFL